MSLKTNDHTTAGKSHCIHFHNVIHSHCDLLLYDNAHTSHISKHIRIEKEPNDGSDA